jgi:hypothetical protein
MSGFFPPAYVSLNTPAYETNQNGPSPANVINTPLTIQSDNKLKSAVFQVSNDSVLSITNSTDATFADFAIQSSGNTYIQPQGAGKFVQVGQAQVGGAVLNISGSLGSGRVYDTVYNKPPSYQSLTTLVATGTGNIAIDTTASLTAGVYQLQFFAETVAPASATRLRMYATAPLSSSVINYSGASVAADANLAEVNLISGYFTAATSGTYRFFVACSNLSAPWSASEYGLQLVKLA